MQAGDGSSGESDAEGTTPLLGSRVANGHSPYRPGSAIGVPSTVVEPPNVYRSRWRSIRVMYLTMFLGSVTFTITMSSLWPFLQVLNHSVNASFLGWVVASYSLGQLVASPLFGGWANLRQSSREPLTVSLTLTTFSNLFYMYLQSIPSHRDYYMILARGLIGFSAGNVAVVRSYVSGATTVKERTSCMANVSIFQAMGFILGPVIQAALVPVGYPGPSEAAGFHFNMYTAPAFFAVCVALVNLMLLIFVFKEHRVYDDDMTANVQEPSGNHEEGRGARDVANNSYADMDYKPDYVAVLSTIFLFFVVLFMFTVFETIGTPLTMHMYAWTKSKATLYQGILLGVAGCLSIVVFIVVKILAKKFNERFLLLAGFIFCFCGYFIFIPWGSDLPPQGFAPLHNSTPPTGPEAMFTLFDHLLYSDHPFDISGDDNDGDTHSRFKRELPITNGQPAYIKKFIVSGNAHDPSVPRDDAYIPGSDENIESSSVDSKTGVLLDPQLSKNTLVYEDLHRTVGSGNGPTSTTITVSMLAFKKPNTTHSTPPTNTTRTTPSNSTKTTSATTRSTVTSTTAATTTTRPYNTTLPSHNSTIGPEGCPWQYPWCGYVPVIHLGQYLCGTAMISIGYPMCNMLTYTVYSKVLGPKPQGLWMGWLTASGSLARTVGPIYVSQVYDSFGPQVTFGSCGAFILVTIGFYALVFRRLVPFSFKDESLTRFGGSVTQRR